MAYILQTLGTQLMTGLQQGSPADSSLPLEYLIYIVLCILAALTGISIVLFMGGVYLSKTRFFHRIALSTTQATHQGYTACTYPDSLIGMQGITQTPLRPAGKVTIRGVCYDVKTIGTYVASGAAVVVTDVAGTALTVQAIHTA